MFRFLSLAIFIGFNIENGFAFWPGTKITDELDFIGEKQVYFNRKERFIKFDTKDNELEIELGISIPFIKVPLNVAAKENGEPHEESVISINGPGLVVAGALMLTSLIIIPLFFMKKPIYEGFGYGRTAGEENGFWGVMKDVEEVLSHNHIDSTTCGQKAVCWIAKTSKGGKEGSIGKWIDGMLSTWWVHRLIYGTFVDEAVNAGQANETCSIKYPQCPINQDHIKLAATTFMSGFKKR